MFERVPVPSIVMAGLDPATQQPRGSAAKRLSQCQAVRDEFPARADARALGGRVKPGHDERCEVR